MRLEEMSSRVRDRAARTLVGTFLSAICERRSSVREMQDWMKSSGRSSIGLRERERETIWSACWCKATGIVRRERPERSTRS